MELDLDLSLLHLGRESSGNEAEGLGKGSGCCCRSFFYLEQTQGEANHTGVPLQGFILISALTRLDFEWNCR